MGDMARATARHEMKMRKIRGMLESNQHYIEEEGYSIQLNGEGQGMRRLEPDEVAGWAFVSC
jgi:hypothetical protein